MPGRVRAVAVVAAALAMLAPGVAEAAWNSTSPGAGRGAARTLPAVGPVSSTCVGGAIRVSWAASELATGYEVYRSSSFGLSWTLVASTASTTYVDSPGLVDVTLVWRVVATRSAWRAVPSGASPPRTMSPIGLCL